MVWILLGLCSLLFIVSTTTSAVATPEPLDPFYWDHIDVSIDVQANGDRLITEEQEYILTDRTQTKGIAIFHSQK